MNLVDKVKALIEKENLIGKGDRVLLGASGGIDSTTLLFVLDEIKRSLPFDLGLAHVNHQLRGEESERDEGFVRGLGERFDLPIYVKKADVKGHAVRSGLSVQHAGRTVRYDFFEEMAKAHRYNRVAIAHNLDDQVETFILRLLKGTGIRGLSAIPLRRGRIIRPFLETHRQEIEAHAMKYSVPHVEDSSNDRDVYERNFIRKHVLPPMGKVNPAFTEKIFQLSRDLVSINEFYDERAVRFLDEDIRENEGEVTVGVERLVHLDEETRFRVIASMFSKVAPQFIPLREHIQLTEKLLTGSRPNLAVVLPRGIKVRKAYKKLIVTTKPAIPVHKGIFPVSSGENKLEPFMLTLDISLLHRPPESFPSDPYTAFFDAEKIGSLYVRTFLEGDRFHPLGMKSSVKLKDFFISRKLPMEQRRRVPLLVSDGDIVWIIGIRIDDRYKVEDETRSIFKVVAKTYQ
jgi:tRNA(Ile)-lysidine synthase